VIDLLEPQLAFNLCQREMLKLVLLLAVEHHKADQIRAFPLTALGRVRDEPLAIVVPVRGRDD